MPLPPVFEASARGDLEEVIRLVSTEGVGVIDQTRHFGTPFTAVTPLGVAALFNRLEVVKYLVEDSGQGRRKGKDINVALSFAIDGRNKYTLGLGLGLTVDDRRLPLECIEYLAGWGYKALPFTEMPPIVAAAGKWDSAATRILVGTGKYDVNVECIMYHPPLRKTPLAVAIAQCHWESARLLVKAGANPVARTRIRGRCMTLATAATFNACPGGLKRLLKSAVQEPERAILLDKLRTVQELPALAAPGSGSGKKRRITQGLAVRVEAGNPLPRGEVSAAPPLKTKVYRDKAETVRAVAGYVTGVGELAMRNEHFVELMQLMLPAWSPNRAGILKATITSQYERK